MNINNNIQIIGNLGNNAEVKTFESGKSVLSFSIAESYVKNNKEKVTRWHECKFWAKAELADIFSQGTQIALTGQLDYEEYEKEGVKIKKAILLVDQFRTFGSKKQEA